MLVHVMRACTQPQHTHTTPFSLIEVIEPPTATQETLHVRYESEVKAKEKLIKRVGRRKHPTREPLGKTWHQVLSVQCPIEAPGFPAKLGYSSRQLPCVPIKRKRLP